MKIGLGMDTGGTYTDAVIMDLDTGKVLDKAKSMTTREDLCIGIRGAIEGIGEEYMRDVTVVALSSTLATNSVVEGKGCRVGLVCIGGDYNRAVNADYSVRVAGGHDYHGDPNEPLDVDAVRGFLESVRGRIDGLAVSGYLSIRNPEHEDAVREMAKDILGVPVVCGHELSSSLGFSERTTTCIMNSRLIPVMDGLIRSVEAVLGEKGVHAPLMIFRGDGTMMSGAVARERPVETILSGPAASLMGAMHMTGIRDAVVMDMGGTTTDIGVLRDGRPSLDPEGAVIGGKRTRVMAAQIATSGIGGDSRIVVNQGRIVLTSLRVMPLCVAARRWSHVAESLSSVYANLPTRYMRPVNVENKVFRTEFLRTIGRPRDPSMVTEADNELLELASSRPYTVSGAAMELRRDEYEFNIPSLESYGFIQRIGLTPTDILHADGTYTEFDADASKAGVAYMAALAGMSPETFIAKARDAIRNKLALELAKVVLTEDSGELDLGKTGMDMVMKSITGTPGKDFHCTLALDKPIIGIGAPSGVYIRWMAGVFGTDVIIDGDSDVGNAVGAITSSVSESIDILIRPMLMVKAKGEYEAFSKLGRFRYDSIEEAISDQEARAREYVVAAAERSNAENVCVSVDSDRHLYMTLPGGRDLDEVEMCITAAGKPKQFLR